MDLEGGADGGFQGALDPGGVQSVFGRRCEVFFTGHGKTQSWTRDHYAYGEASLLLPGRRTELFPDVPTPEGPPAASHGRAVEPHVR
ncbi:hypothetical protein ACF09L_07995 [Streptomyces sp. NPDC014779]|uniref:hypothetical protein n=1 Tax=unclassified Streptomyces TaxID=2593676 RepID=UPI0036FD8197